MCLSVCACVSTYSYEVIKLENIRRINIYIYDEHVPYQSREKEKNTVATSVCAPKQEYKNHGPS